MSAAKRLPRLPAPLAPARPPRSLHREGRDRGAGVALARTAAPLQPGSRSRRWRRRSRRRCSSQIAAVPESRLAADLLAAQCWACCRHDPRFPVGLRDAADAPWALIGRGDPALLERLEPEATVTIVGARRASAYGREVARDLGRELTAAGLLVTSGLAFGIDACAHRGALDVGTTVAVLGCGADVAYPASHRSLWRRICEQGLVLSELPPGTGAWRWSFPGAQPDHGGACRDDRGGRGGPALGLADHRRSCRRPRPRPGSRARARSTRAARRAPTICLPVAPAWSAAPRTCSTRCWARACAGPSAAARISSQQLLGVLSAVEGGAQTCDAVAAELDLSGAEAAAALATLEALGYVSCSLVGTYSRTLLAAPDV